jgi:hypothetical protein
VPPDTLVLPSGSFVDVAGEGTITLVFPQAMNMSEVPAADQFDALWGVTPLTVFATRWVDSTHFEIDYEDGPSPYPGLLLDYTGAGSGGEFTTAGSDVYDDWDDLECPDVSP